MDSAGDPQKHRLEHALRFAVRSAIEESPPALAQAIEHAVFPGGARLRPLLCLLVAGAHGDPDPGVTTAAAVAVELLHCASLVHDDLPCFDDADMRRGRPSVHRKFGEATAVLTGDALIVMAFDVLGRAETRVPVNGGRLVRVLARAAGPAHGLVAGQAWEIEPRAPLGRCHRAKTASLFEAAARAGAIASGGDEDAWANVGLKLGELYQLADDLADATARAEDLGKPVGQDAAHARPSAVRSFGIEEARRRIGQKVDEALAAVPKSGASVGAWLETALTRVLGSASASTHAGEDPSARKTFIVRTG